MTNGTKNKGNDNSSGSRKEIDFEKAQKELEKAMRLLKDINSTKDNDDEDPDDPDNS